MRTRQLRGGEASGRRETRDWLILVNRRYCPNGLGTRVLRNPYQLLFLLR